jgi:membrane-associated phospholipid phosphatase
LLRGPVRSQQHGGSAPEEKVSRFPGLIWLLSLLVCVLVVAVAFAYFDVPIARRVFGTLSPAENLAKGLTSAVLLSAEAAVALTLIVVRITRGRLSPLGEAAALACLTSICAFSVNDSVLKFFFGVPNPSAVLHGARHAFNLMSGSASNSFPSGHMVLSGAFAGVFMRLYRRSIVPFSALLLIGAALLVVGDWHFLSDAIAGMFVGVSAGLLAGEVWSAHSSRTLRGR